MQAKTAPDVSVSSLKLPNENFGNSSKYVNYSDPKPKMNITLDSSTYTKTIDLNLQDFYKLSNFGSFSSDSNHAYPQSAVPTSVNEPVASTVAPNTTPNSQDDSSFFSLWRKPGTSSKSTFFTRLARRLTIRRANSKPPSVIPASNDPDSLKPPCQAPASLKIRRWLSKHLIQPQKKSPCKQSPQAFSTRAATFDGAIDKRILQPAEDFGSVPTQRRGMLQTNLSVSSLCDSQAGTLSLGNNLLEINGIGIPQCSHSCEKQRLTSPCASGSIPAKQDNHISQLFSAFSSPSVTASGPPPRYLNVSLAAFGYTCCNRKWVSAQTLKHGATAVGEAREPSPTFEDNTNTTSAFLGTTASPQRTDPVQRPYQLDLQNGCNGPVVSSTPRDSGPVSPVFTAVEHSINNTINNCSGVTIRVKRNVSNRNSSQLICGAESDQPQDLNRSNHSHHEHWNRSSLIMLAVAQASPRGHNAPSTASTNAGAANSNPPSTYGGRFSFTESPGNSTGFITASPSKTFFGLRPILNDDSSSADATMSNVDEATTLNTADLSHIEKEKFVAIAGGLEEVTASLSSAAINGHTDANEGHEDAASVESQKTVVRDGHFFLRLADKIALELRSRVEEIDRDLNENEISEEVSGHLRTTVGKVNLLLSQKFVQFRGLCANCIEAADRAPVEGEFVTLPSDLEGFWAMVMLQVDDLRSMIASCDHLRQSGWKVDSGVTAIANGACNNRSGTVLTKRRQPKSVTANHSKDTEAVSLARNQARERLRAAKRQYMRARMEELTANRSLNSGGNADTSVPENGGSPTFLVL